MKTPRHSNSSRPVGESKQRTKPNYEQVLRTCETAAARIKSAGDELVASWSALRQEISTASSSTDLLRKRAWCNVLELRLKEEAYALEEARHSLDAVWDEMMLTARARELLNRFIKKDAGEELAANESLPLLARTASVIAAAHRRPPNSLKK